MTRGDRRALVAARRALEAIDDRDDTCHVKARFPNGLRGPKCRAAGRHGVFDDVVHGALGHQEGPLGRGALRDEHLALAMPADGTDAGEQLVADAGGSEFARPQ